MVLFKFDYTIHSGNDILNDQQVVQYRFIILGNTRCIINNQLEMKIGTPTATYIEELHAGEKTATQYQLKWDDPLDPNNRLLVITKIPFVKK